jgi:hypothetical protein
MLQHNPDDFITSNEKTKGELKSPDFDFGRSHVPSYQVNQQRLTFFGTSKAVGYI